MDTRLYFLKEPVVIIGILLLGTIYYFGRNSVDRETEMTETEVKYDMQENETETETKTDTTQWRKSYYNHLYWSK